jgi:hypothetical protein
MNPTAPRDTLRRPDPESGRDPRLTAAVQDAFGGPCPDRVAVQVLAAVRDQERSLHAWQARWLFAIPAIEVLLLVLQRSELAGLLRPAGQLWSALRDTAVPSYQGCADWLVSCWHTAGRLMAAEAPLPLDLVPYACAALIAAAASGILVLRMEKPHA